MSVSVVLLQHNFPWFTEAAYESIMRGSLVPDEVIVVDNNSDPHSRKWYKKHKRKKHFRAIELAENRAYIGGTNAGWREAKGDYVVLANNDIVISHNCLENLIASVKLDDRIGYLHSSYLSGPWVNAVANVPESAKDGVPGDMTALDAYCSDLAPAYVTVSVTEATLFVVPKRVSDECGYFWEELRSWHTHDYSWRLRDAGYVTAVCPSSVFWHHCGHPTLSAAGWGFQEADRMSEELIKGRWGGTGDMSISRNSVIRSSESGLFG